MPPKQLVVVGGGIVGVATAWRLAEELPNWRIRLLEKEPALAQHQTGRNSGVIHSGIYYPPGSLKAHTCLEGRRLMEDFCEAEGLPWERCGKVIVATRAAELPRLDNLEARAREHGLQIKRLTPSQLQDLEPACRGLAALHVPETGIAGYRAVTERMADKARERGVDIVLGARVRRIKENRIVHGRGDAPFDFWVNCAGLYSDRLVELGGQEPEARIVPFRGEYYTLKDEARGLCRNLIYPVPDPRFPFLGVHFTRGVDGAVEAGPNAVLSLGRENYTGRNINWDETWETLGYSGFQRLALKYWRMGLEEQLRSLFKRLFLRSLQELVPSVQLGDLLPGGAGIRAQAVRPNGSLVDDFVIQSGPRAVHIVNAPSPAATASLAIARRVVEEVRSAL